MIPRPSNPARTIPARGDITRLPDPRRKPGGQALEEFDTRATIVCGAGEPRRKLLEAAGSALVPMLAEFGLDDFPIRAAQRAGAVILLGDDGARAGVVRRLAQAPVPAAVVVLDASRVGSPFRFDRRLTWPELPLLPAIVAAEATRSPSQRLARAFARWSSLPDQLGRALWIVFVGSPVETVQGLARQIDPSTRSLQVWWREAVDPNVLPLRDVMRTARLLRWVEAGETTSRKTMRANMSLSTLCRIAREVLDLEDDPRRLTSRQTEDAFIDRLNNAVRSSSA